MKKYLVLLLGSLVGSVTGAVLVMNSHKTPIAHAEAGSTPAAPAVPTAAPSNSPNSGSPDSQTPIATLTNNDYAHPKLSPDGKKLAYSEVLVENGVENTAVKVYDLQSQKTLVLLDPEKARTYQTYKAYVSSIKWPQPDRLEVMVNDGDVDSTLLTFNPQTGELLSQEAREGGRIPELTAEQRQIRQQVITVFPNLTAEDLGTYSDRYVQGQGGLFLSGNLLNQGENTWFLDLVHKTMNPLFAANSPLAKTTAYEAVTVGGSTLLLLNDFSTDAKSFLVAYKDGVIQQLANIPTPTSNGSMEVLHQSSQRAIVLIKIHPSYEQGDNPLFIFENNQLTRLQEYPELYDADVDDQGTRIVYCYWQDGKRYMAVKALSQP